MGTAGLMDKKLFFSLLAFAAVACAIYLIVFLLTPFLGAMVWAAVLAMASHPMYRRILKAVKGRENLAAFLSTAVVCVLLAIPFFIIALVFAGQAFDVLSGFEDAVQKGQLPLWESLKSNPKVAHYIEKLQSLMGQDDLQQMGVTTFKGVWNVLAYTSKKLTMNVFSAIFQFLMTILLLFFAYRDGDKVVGTAWDIVPLKESDKRRIEDIFKRIVNAVLYGIVLACVAQGILGGIGFAIAGIPAPVFYGALMTLSAFIPVVGPALVWGPGVAYLFIKGDTGAAIFLLIWCVVVVSCIDNVIRPLYISGKSKIPLPIIFLGVLGGLMTLGFLGIILGPLILSLFVEAVRIYKEEIMIPHQSESGKV